MLVHFKTMSIDKLEQLATAYAINALEKLKISNIPLAYEIIVILQLLGSHS